jgi:hypothetical protein
MQLLQPGLLFPQNICLSPPGTPVSRKWACSLTGHSAVSPFRFSVVSRSRKNKKFYENVNGGGQYHNNIMHGTVCCNHERRNIYSYVVNQ